MFMKALDQMGKLDDPFFGNAPSDDTVKLVFNLSQGDDVRGFEDSGSELGGAPTSSRPSTP